jgi:hypothetical protein
MRVLMMQKIKMLTLKKVVPNKGRTMRLRAPIKGPRINKGNSLNKRPTMKRPTTRTIGQNKGPKMRVISRVCNVQL